MTARMRSVFGWFRRLPVFGSPRSGSRERFSRVPSTLDALERRQVLSTTTLAQVAILPSQTTTIAPPTPFVAVTAVPTTLVASPSIATVTAASVPNPPTVQVTATSGQTVVLSAVVGSSTADPDTAFVQSVYEKVLLRPGSAAEVAGWDAALASGMSPKDMVGGLVGTAESRTVEVDQLYAKYLHRGPDPRTADWVNAMVSGASLEQVAEGILDSPEYQTAHQDPSLFVRDLYIDVLGRQGTAPELAAWQTKLAQGMDRGTVVASFVESNEATDNAIDSFYHDFLNRAPETGAVAAWAQVAETPGNSNVDAAIGILSSREFIKNSI